MAFVLFVLVRCKTGTLDTLNNVSLTEEVEDDKGSYDEHTASVLNSRYVQVAACVVGIKSLGNLNNVGKECRTGDIVEQLSVEVVSPLPAECEHEYCDHHCAGERKNDSEECSEDTGTVKISGFFELVGNTAVELTEHEDEQTVFVCKTCH